jgi:DNA modification methylase
MDCIEGMKTLPDGCVNTIVTSPPYYGLRDYGVDGQIGLELTPEEYVVKMVEVFREGKRILRDDGTLWLNLGDCYAGSGKGAWNNKNGGQKEVYIPDTNSRQARMPKTFNGIKAKDLIGMPWRVAFALQADGWYLRSDIIWSKPNPMPESVTDRPTKAHEYLFLLTKSPKYYYDFEAIQETAVKGEYANGFRGGSYCNNSTFDNSEGGKRKSIGNISYGGKKYTENPDVFNRTKSGELYKYTGKRNKRTIWTVATKPFSEAHFATFPPDLIKPCILAGCPGNGTVLDMFMGAGTTAATAFELGRNYLGFELNKEYCEIAERRIETAKKRKEALGIPLFDDKAVSQ